VRTGGDSRMICIRRRIAIRLACSRACERGLHTQPDLTVELHVINDIIG